MWRRRESASLLPKRSPLPVVTLCTLVVRRRNRSADPAFRSKMSMNRLDSLVFAKSDAHRPSCLFGCTPAPFLLLRVEVKCTEGRARGAVVENVRLSLEAHIVHSRLGYPLRREMHHHPTCFGCPKEHGGPIESLANLPRSMYMYVLVVAR